MAGHPVCARRELQRSVGPKVLASVHASCVLVESAFRAAMLHAHGWSMPQGSLIGCTCAGHAAVAVAAVAGVYPVCMGGGRTAAQ